MELILEPLGFNFVIRALVAAFIVGVVCSVLGTYVVLRGMAFFGDALAHTILPGVVVSFLLGWPLALGALIMGIVTALGIGALSDRGALREDTAIGVVFAGLFALGVAMLSATGNYTVDLTHFLFGNLLGVTTTDVLVAAVLGLTVLILIFLFFKELMVVSFDPTLATTLRLPTRFLHYLLLVLLAVTIVVALQVVGIALTLAMLVTPAATASLLTQRLPTMMVVSGIIGAVSGVFGVFAAYHLDLASGPVVVLIATALFLAVFLYSSGRGVLGGAAATTDTVNG
ncbi:MAG: metal ABC transporter permease [Candidatus Promineifilaceae bacterium]|nr:metal ABC transporter permease [Candidatus Promineifilaceae bacterium]